MLRVTSLTLIVLLSGGRTTINGFASALRRASSILTFAVVLAGAGVLPATISRTKVAGQPEELVVTRSAGPSTPDTTPWFDRAKGLVLRDLVPGASQCPGGWALIGDPSICTHGPDRARPGLDVTRARSTTELAEAIDEGATETSSATAPIPCYGDGVSGKRVQVVYAHAADAPDRFGELAPLLAQWVANVDGVFNQSAAQTGGVRHVRWVTDPDCNLAIQRVQLTDTGDDTFSTTVSELRSVELQHPDRKYLIWTDATVYCGIATLYRDDTAGLLNKNNVSSGYARIDSGCWGLSKSTEAHELMHLLGGVQYTAPHSSGGGHCTDDYDRMCYADAQDVSMAQPCDLADEKLFDCNDDDYFSTSPPDVSYLATHWNTAFSSFLEAADPPAWSPGTPSPTPDAASPEPTPSLTTPEPAPSPSPTESPSTSTTSTVTFTGALSRKSPPPAYPIAVGDGTLAASLSFTKGSAITLTLLDADGAAIETRTGGSPVGISVVLPEGAYSIVVSGRGNTPFKLTVTYETP